MNNDNNNYEYQKQLIKDAIREIQEENLQKIIETEKQIEKEERKTKITLLLINLWPLILILISLIIGGFISTFNQ